MDINISVYVIDSIQFGFAIHPRHISFYNSLYRKVKRRLVYKMFIRNFKFRYLSVNQMFYGNFWNSGSCTCAAGVVTGGGTCADDIEPAQECENLMSLVCKSNGVAEGSRVTKANGCDKCKTLRKICATTCNYCT